MEVLDKNYVIKRGHWGWVVQQANGLKSELGYFARLEWAENFVLIKAGEDYAKEIKANP